MRLVARTLALFCLAALLASPLLAEDKKADKKQPAKNPYGQTFSFPKGITPDANQQAKLDELKKEYGPRLDELNAKLAKVMTPERQKAAAAARKAAQGEGKKGKEVQEAVLTALKLSSEEEAQYKEVQQARTKLNREINKKKTELLTDEQKEKLKKKPK
jgi:hypothetical protein